MKYPLILPEECVQILTEIEYSVPWVKGKSPDPEYDNLKNNLEYVIGSTGVDFTVMDRIMGCEFLTARTMPKKMGHARFSLYKAGMGYGKQFEPAFYGTDAKIRTDISVCVFLSDPDTYEGGELVLDYPSGAMISLKEPQGTLVYYPTSVMHRINPVDSGERITFDAFIESHIQDPQRREILSEMESACAEMESLEPFSGLNLRMANIKHNLYRQWMTTT